MTDSRTSELTGEGAATGGAILIVDDRPDKLVTLQAALSPLEHEIVTAESGPQALRWLLRRDFAVVLLDVNMPGMGGFETARLIRQRRRNLHTPLIFVTAYGDDVHCVEAYALGAVDFLSAPIVPAVLRSKVRVFLELNRRDAQLREHAERLLWQTSRLQALARASLEIHAARSIRQTMQIVADSAREILESPQTGIILLSEIGPAQHELVVSQGNALGQPAPRSGVPWGIDLAEIVARLDSCPRPTADELAALQLGNSWGSCWPGDSSGTCSGLAAPLVARGGKNVGLLLACGRRDGEYTLDEEALFVQLAQMGAASIENTLFADACESNRMKDEFLATLSHELRTPLSSVLGWAQLLKTNMLDAEETAEAIDIIERNGQMQRKLIDDLLDVSRIVTGKMQVNLRPVSLIAAVQAAVDVILPSAQAKQVRIETSFDPHADRISGDADRLQQVLWNLLSNAVKFTPAGERIEVSLESVESRARVCVRDYGEGIAPEFLPHMFDRFRQADSSASRKHGGLGIGLAIVRHVVELHGGSVRAESDGPGRGTTITVTLPLAAVQLNTDSNGSASRTAAGNSGHRSGSVQMAEVDDVDAEDKVLQ